MKTLQDILPLNLNLVLIAGGCGYSVKRLSRQSPDSNLIAFTQPIHGKSVRTLKKMGYQFLPCNAWPWNDQGKIDGVNPSLPKNNP